MVTMDIGNHSFLEVLGQPMQVRGVHAFNLIEVSIDEEIIK